ncbi:MAG TPA: anthranilate phosphoribosyltransferase [Caldithrix abyssi]|uniref:Anthranilate phosphoribosyltransferase n=1 Tax=Caldithrix abyssi TaxID=187145 RepID=A0A7V5PNF2_CALAY|nr:anthranilate phosphoribosyltransferase [Caldithrix abyssi]
MAAKSKKASEGSQVLREAIAKLMEGRDLSREESRLVMREIMEKKATDAQISAYLVALRMKGETVDEVTGSAEAFAHTGQMEIQDANVVDICGTGGDNLHTFNISTTAAFVAAGAGVTVAKHGHRSVSSRCGSADLLQALGVNINVPRERVKECLNTIGIGFFFDPKFHKAWHYALGPRQEIGARTIFNIMGPLTNPARIRRQVIGVYDPTLMPLIARVMKELGAKHVMVVHGSDGLDEITITGPTRTFELFDGEIKEYEINPEDYQLSISDLQYIQSHSCNENVRYLQRVLDGEHGPARDVVLLNAGAAIKVSGKAKDLQGGIRMAVESIESGAAKEKVQKLIELSNRH